MYCQTYIEISVESKAFNIFAQPLDEHVCDGAQKYIIYNGTQSVYVEMWRISTVECEQQAILWYIHI